MKIIEAVLRWSIIISLGAAGLCFMAAGALGAYAIFTTQIMAG